MISFVALYRGDSATEARMVAVSSDRTIVAEFADRLLSQPPPETGTIADPALRSIERGRRSALRLIAREAKATTRPMAVQP